MPSLQKLLFLIAEHECKLTIEDGSLESFLREPAIRITVGKGLVRYYSIVGKRELIESSVDNDTYLLMHIEAALKELGILSN